MLCNILRAIVLSVATVAAASLFPRDQQTCGVGYDGCPTDESCYMLVDQEAFYKHVYRGVDAGQCKTNKYCCDNKDFIYPKNPPKTAPGAACFTVNGVPPSCP